MARLNRPVVISACLLALSAGSLSAHHSFSAEFDATKPVRLKGPVSTIQWTNPHVLICLSVKRSNGSVEEWTVETSTPVVLSRRGISERALAVGTQVVIDAYRAKDGSRRATGRFLTLPDGRRLSLGSPS